MSDSDLCAQNMTDLGKLSNFSYHEMILCYTFHLFVQ